MFSETNILMAVVSLVLLWWSYHFCWQRALLNRYRQRLYATRSDLFMSAAEGKISCNDPAYGMLRMMLNGLIRGSEQFTVFSVLLAIFSKRWIDRFDTSLLPKPLPNKLIDCINQMKDEERADVYRKFTEQMMRESSYYVMSWTPVIGIVVFVLIIVLPIRILNFLLKPSSYRVATDYVDGTIVLNNRNDGGFPNDRTPALI